MTSDDDDGPTLRHRWFDLSTMEPRLRVLTLIVFAQILAAAIMLVLREADLCAPYGIADCTYDILDMKIQYPNYFMSYGLVVAALVLGVFGLRKADIRGGLAFLSVLSLIYVIAIFGFFHDPLDKIARVFVVFLVAIAIGFGPEMMHERQQAWIVRGVIALIFAPILINLAFSKAAFGLTIILLRIPLAYLYVLAGTDWAEIDDAFLRWLARTPAIRANQRYLYFVGVGAAATVAVGGGMIAGYPAIYRLPVALAAALALLLVLQRLDGHGQWRIQFPWAALALMVIGFHLLAGVFVFNFRMEYSVGSALSVWPAVGIFALVFAISAAAALIRASRDPRLVGYAATLLFGVVISLTYAVQLLITFDNADRVRPDTSLLCYFGTGSLIALALLYPRRNDPSMSEPLRAVALFNAGLIGIYLLVDVVYAGMRSAGKSGPLVAAAVVLVAISWDIVTSGHSITNVDGKWFPRRSRVLLFFAFTTLAVAIVLFFGSLYGGPEESQRMAETYADPEALVQMGIQWTAPSFLFTLLLLRLGKWRGAMVQSTGSRPVELTATRF